jgi:hypothetical protein
VAELLAMWERSDGERVARAALGLLAAASPEERESELAALPVGRRDAALLALRERLFGSQFTGRTTCPACGEQIELSFDADEVRRDAAPATSFAMEIDGHDVELRPPSTRDLEAIEALDDVAAARDVLLARCVTFHGAPPPHISDAIAARLGELDPQADVALDVDCPTCAHAWREPFDIVTFLRAELDAAARRALTDVHRLALAYGWSERDILALSPARRAAYLEMLA